MTTQSDHLWYADPWTPGDRFRKARERFTGLDQIEFAARIGASRQTVSNYETDNTHRHVRAIVAAWALATGTTSELDTATRRDGVAYLAQWDAAETRRAYRTGIRGLHAWLVLEKERADNPTLELPKIPRPKPNPRPIPDTVVLDALDRASDRDAAMVVLGRFAGLRAAEIAGASRMYLRWQDGEQVVHLLGKGDRWRTVPAHPDVAAVLSQASGHLFVNRHGLPITPNTVTRRMSRLLGEGWTSHSLRSGFASELYEETGDIALVSKLLGHADIETTKRYVLIRDVRAAEAVARLRLRAA